MTVATALAVLIVEDLESDGQLIVRALNRAGYVVSAERVETAGEMSAALDRRAWDIVISDYSLPEFDGRRALALLRATGRDIPFIVISGTIGEATAVAMMKAGAHDYLLKGDLARLPPAVERELAQAEVRRERQQSEQALARRAEQFGLLYDVGLALNRVLEPRAQLETIFKIAIQALHAARGEFFRYDAASQELRLELVYGYPEELAPVAMQKLDFVYGQNQGLWSRVGALRRPVYLPDVRAEPRWTVVDPAILSALWVPVEHEGQLLGVLGVLAETIDAFAPDDQRLLELFATQLAVALANAHQFAEIRQRLAELEAVSSISKSVRTAGTLDEMLPVWLDVTLAVMHASGGSVWLYDSATAELRPAVIRGWTQPAGAGPVLPEKPGVGLNGHVFVTGQPYVSRDFQQDPRVAPGVRERIPPGGGAAVPIRVGDQIIGTFVVDLPPGLAVTPGEVHLLTTLSEIAGSAIHRMRLFEQTEKRLNQITTLRAIDSAINASLDVHVTLEIFLEQVVGQLGVHAADVLLLEPDSRTLYYAAGRGFRTRDFAQGRQRLGEGRAGRVALERRLLIIPELHADDLPSRRTASLQREDFVSYVGVPLIAKGQVLGVLELFHRLPLQTNPEWLQFVETLAGQASIAIENARLFDDLQQANQGLVTAYDATIEGWSAALDLRDHETEGHTQRVTELTERLARGMGRSDAELVHIRRGALLHDIGKMGIPDAILLKPGPLTEGEWAIMREHPAVAYRLLEPIRFLRPALEIPYCHHEKWDGTGYPRGLSGEQIPLAARVFAVVDVWDALRSDRPYRAAWPAERVREYLLSQAGTHFEPQIVDAALQSDLFAQPGRA